MPTKSSTGRGASGAPSAGAALRTGARPAPATRCSTRWPRPWRSTAAWRLSTASKSACSRLPAPCRGASPFRPASASRTRRCCNAIAASGAKIDVFTLDTGRHFPETLRYAGSQREPLRPQYPRHVPRRPRGRGARCPRRHLRLPPRRREPQGLLRHPQGAAAEARARRRQGLGHGTAPRAVGRPRARAVRRVGRGERARQAEPDRRLEPRASSKPTSPPTTSRSIRCTRAASRRSDASRARAPSSRARTFAPDAGGGRTRTARNAACTTGLARRKLLHDGSVIAPRHARGRGHLIFPRGRRAVPQAGADVFDRQGLDRPAAPGAQGVLAAEAAVPAAPHRHDVEVQGHDRLPRQDGARFRPRPHRAHERGRPEARHQSLRPLAVRLHRRDEDAAAEAGARQVRLRRGLRRRPPRRGKLARQGARVLLPRAPAIAGIRAVSARRCGTCSTGASAPARRCACSRCRTGPSATCGATSCARSSTSCRCTSPPAARPSRATASCSWSTTTACRCCPARCRR